MSVANPEERMKENERLKVLKNKLSNSNEEQDVQIEDEDETGGKGMKFV